MEACPCCVMSRGGQRLAWRSGAGSGTARTRWGAFRFVLCVLLTAEWNVKLAMQVLSGFYLLAPSCAASIPEVTPTSDPGLLLELRHHTCIPLPGRRSDEAASPPFTSWERHCHLGSRLSPMTTPAASKVGKA